MVFLLSVKIIEILSSEMFKKPILLILLSALILRLIIAPFFEHGDVVQYYYWAMDLWNKGFLGFYDRNIANAMRPTYPPVTSYLFWLSALLHEFTWKIFWFLNNSIPIFPSNLVFWLESEKGWYFFNKLPAIFADTLIIWLLYKFTQNLSPKKLTLLPSLFFAFLPPFWYNSSLWGQTDSIYALFMLAAFYFINKNRIVISALFFLLAILTKPTCLFVLPVFLFWWLKKAKFKAVISAIFINFLVMITFYFPFHPQNLLSWIVTFYERSLGGELSYIVANSFNFWALIFGFQNVPEKTLFLDLPAYIIGNGLFLLTLIACIAYLYIRRKIINFKTVLISASFVSFSAFMFLPRMHDRYFYPVLILLLPLVGLDKKIRFIVLALSLIHFVNLYHFFWVPRVDFWVSLLSNNFVEKEIIILNISLFFFLGKQIFNNYSTQKPLK